MTYAMTNRKKSNRLFHGMIAVSLGFHLLLFMHFSGVYRTEALSYIELTMQDVSKSYSRSIPRPRMRQKVMKISDVDKVNVKKTVIPNFNIAQEKLDLPGSLMEGISTSQMSVDSGLAACNPDYGGIAYFATTADYFEMLRLRIESRKKYPETARARHVEGWVKVRFVVTPDGQVSSLECIRAARLEEMNQAALNAVLDAVPFPAPPRHLFKGPVALEITIRFELT